MIRYALNCDHGHGFEAWFGSSSDYDDQAARGLVECPFCGSHAVEKAVMAPSVSGTKKSAAPDMAAKMQTMMMEAAREVRAQLDGLGASATRIVVTSDLDEHAIAALAAALYAWTKSRAAKV